MDERTRAYLRGRFGDYYRRAEIAEPPDADRREWGYIPWSRGSTTMVRHRSLLEMGNLGEFLADRRPRHVYFSAGYYDEPGADTMGEKGWQGSDLIFDLDADHLPAVDPDEDTNAEMLAACKEALFRLLDFLREDFGFSDLTVVFSGSRGYHVHVREPELRSLSREARREVVDYVRGIDVDFSELLTTETVAGLGRKTPTEKRSLDVRGGWGRRVHGHLLEYVDDLLDLEDEEAIERLQEFDGIGQGKAESALRAARNNYDQIAAGNVDVHPAFYGLARRLTEEAVAAQSAAIDEPVTTDTRRLIRLPGSLHGGTGLRVTPVPLDELSSFDPLTDAVPEVFRGHDIAVRGDGGPPIELGGETFTVPADDVRLPEYAGVFLMARGRAEKEKE